MSGNKPLFNLTFDQWVKYIFDHPVPENPDDTWYWQDDSDYWNDSENPALTVAYLTKAFENIAEIARPYSDAQLNQGLWFVLSAASSNHMFALLNQSVRLEDRFRCIRSFHTIYEKLFAERCSEYLHPIDGNREDYLLRRKPLDAACYMWWELMPIAGDSSNPVQQPIDSAILDVMTKTLEIPSDQCRLGTLHGLGHWSFMYGARVRPIIDDFLLRNPELRPELREYALNARWENIL